MYYDNEDLKDVLDTAASQGCPVMLPDYPEPSGLILHRLQLPGRPDPMASDRLMDILAARGVGAGVEVLFLGFDTSEQLRAAQFVCRDIAIDMPKGFRGAADPWPPDDK